MESKAQLTHMPTISIVTPSYNSADYLERTILSIQAQQYPRIEHILMDGGSTDGTVAIAERYREYFALIESTKDKGMYDAIGRGFAHTTGEIMTWLNSDDEWLPGTLRTIAHLFVEFPDVEWISTSYPCAIDSTGAMISTNRLSGFSLKGYLRGEFLPCCGWPADGLIQQESTFWRRSLWTRAGSRMDESLLSAGDFELWGRFFRYANLWCVQVPLGCFRRRDGQKTAIAFESYLEEAREAFRRQGGRPPARLAARIRVGFRRHAPDTLKRVAAHLGLYERRPFLLYDWSSSRWAQSWA